MSFKEFLKEASKRNIKPSEAKKIIINFKYIPDKFKKLFDTADNVEFRGNNEMTLLKDNKLISSFSISHEPNDKIIVISGGDGKDSFKDIKED